MGPLPSASLNKIAQVLFFRAADRRQIAIAQCLAALSRTVSALIVDDFADWTGTERQVLRPPAFLTAR